MKTLITAAKNKHYTPIVIIHLFGYYYHHPNKKIEDDYPKWNHLGKAIHLTYYSESDHYPVKYIVNFIILKPEDVPA